MRKNLSRALTASLAASLFFVCASLDSCAWKKWNSQRLSDGTVIRWTPSAPEIGDLVTLEAVAGENTDGSANADSRALSARAVRSPSGSAIEPVTSECIAGGAGVGKKIRWSFRVTSAGAWTIDDGKKRQMLWNAATVAGKETELKRFDGDSLWRGSKLKPLPASVGAPAAAGPQGAAP